MTFSYFFEKIHFSHISLKNSNNRLNESDGLVSRAEKTQEGVFSNCKPVKRDIFFSYKHFDSPTRDEPAQSLSSMLPE